MVRVLETEGRGWKPDWLWEPMAVMPQFRAGVCPLACHLLSNHSPYCLFKLVSCCPRSTHLNLFGLVQVWPLQKLGFDCFGLCSGFFSLCAFSISLPSSHC